MILSLLFTFLIHTQSEPIELGLPFDITENQINFYNNDLNVVNQLTFQNTEQIPISKTAIVEVNGNLYFLGKMSGQVYTIKENELVRLDQTPDHRLNINSNIFTNNDTIFKFGGYGYWSQRNFITYFDPPTKEWQLYSTSPNSSPIIGLYNGVHIKNKEGIFFFGGKTINESNRLKSFINKQVIYFNFKTKIFSNIGESLMDFDFENYLVKDDQFIYFKKENKIYQVDPQNNLIKTYKSPNKLWTVSNKKDFNIYKNGKYFIRINDNYNKKNLYTVLTKDEFVGKPIGSFQLYKKDFNFVKIVYLISIVLLLIIIYFIIREAIIKKRIELNSLGLILKKVQYSLEKQEIDILKILIQSKQIDTKSVLSIVENRELTYSHNIRIKDKKIQDLNLKIKTIFNLNQMPIIEIRSSNDRRIKIFVIDQLFQQIFNKIIITKNI